MMKWVVLAISILFATPSLGQRHYIVLTEKGDTIEYSPVPARIVRIHDTTCIYVHDTVSRSVLRESSTVTRIDTGRITLNVFVQHTATVDKPKPASRVEFGVYGWADFRGSLLAPAFSFDFMALRLWLYTGAYYRVDNHYTYFTAGLAGFLPVR